LQKVVCITGHMSGIGKALCEYYNQLEYTVITRYSTGEVLPVIFKDGVVDTDVRVQDYPYIKTDKYDISNIFLVIDCGANNVQCWGEDDPEGNIFRDIMLNNDQKVYSLYNTFIKYLRLNKGLFIGISSTTSSKPLSASSAYCASKAAYDMIFRCLAREESRKITTDEYCSIFTINPISIPETGMVQNLYLEAMNSRGWSYEEAVYHFTDNLHNRQSLNLNDVVKFIIHLTVHNTSLARCMMGTNIPLGIEL